MSSPAGSIQPTTKSQAKEVSSKGGFAMTIHKLEKAEWRPFLDLVSKVLPAKEAEIEVASLKLGDQVQAEWLPLLGLAYDRHRRDGSRRAGSSDPQTTRIVRG